MGIKRCKPYRELERLLAMNNIPFSIVVLLILADGLAYAKHLGATRMIDVATLTGAIVVALGHEATGTMSNDDAFVGEFLRAAAHSGERYWHMPLYDEFTNTVKSEIADVRNSTGREGGSLTAGAFLRTFVGETPWIHLDVAGTAYVDKEQPYAAKGPTGYPVRGLIAFVEDFAKHGSGDRELVGSAVGS